MYSGTDDFTRVALLLKVDAEGITNDVEVEVDTDELHPLDHIDFIS